MNALVSVICVCHNHEPFVLEALNSIQSQTYKNIEIIIVDDGSSDHSVSIIEQWLTQHPNTKFINLKSNQGYCKAFNKALAMATGEYIIDFATDDVCPPEKIEHQVEFFSKLDASYGIVFTDAQYIDGQGKYLRDHFQYLFKKKLLKTIPIGDVYRDVLSLYFIPSPTMMVRSSVFRSIGGYDETLAYEDFDFWIRASRNFKFSYLDKKLMLIRRNTKSMSSGWYKKGDPQLLSTYHVCQKAQKLNRDEKDWNAWAWRVKYELRQAVFSQNHIEAKLFYDLLKEANKVNRKDWITYQVDGLRLPLAALRNVYHLIRFDSFN